MAVSGYTGPMKGKKKSSHGIPPGAPGHPRQGASGAGRAATRAGGRTAPKGARREDRESGDGEGRTSGHTVAGRDEPPRVGDRRDAPAYGRGDTGIFSGKRATMRNRSQLAVLYEDDDIVAVDKPAGLPVIAAEGSRAKSLYDVVTGYIRRRNPKGRAAVVHRLDRESSGALVFAKSGAAKAALMSHWDSLAKERLYEALVEGDMEADEGSLDSWLVEAGPTRMRVAEPSERGALRAVTNWRVIGRGNGFSLLELSLETGRKHQIRAQLADKGHPVAGDERYGSRRDPAGRLCLHAVLLVLVQPFTRELLRIRSPAPSEFMQALHPKELRRAPGTKAPRAKIAGEMPMGGKAPKAKATDGKAIVDAQKKKALNKPIARDAAPSGSSRPAGSGEKPRDHLLLGKKPPKKSPRPSTPR